MTETILVTGASGFIGSHTVIELLNHGYEVRGTLRNLDRAESLRAMFAKHTNNIAALEFVQASLTDADCWLAAIEDCSGVFHIASPVPVEQPDNADEIIVPAREGTLNVLQAAKSAGIKRVVLTSSVAAVSSGQQHAGELLTANHWTDLQSPGLTPYVMSKTIAERAAWNFIAQEGPELVTVNPAMVLGPALESDYGSSLEVLLILLTGQFPMVPQLGLGIVDVRDVASLHRLAYEQPEAAGQRLIASNGFLWFKDIATVLRQHFLQYDAKLPRRELPNFLARLMARFNKPLASLVNDLGKVKLYDITPAQQLGWQPRSAEQAIVDGAQSLIDAKVI